MKQKKIMSNRNNGIQFSSNVIHNVDYVEALLKQFFLYHSNFLWDKAKEYIERERDQFRATTINTWLVWTFNLGFIDECSRSINFG